MKTRDPYKAMAALSAEQMQQMMAAIQTNMVDAIGKLLTQNRESDKEATAAAAETAAQVAREVVRVQGEQFNQEQSAKRFAREQTAAEDRSAAQERATAAAMGQQSAEPRSDKPREDRPQKLDLRNFQKVDKFSGGEAAWKDWSFDFKVMVNSINPSMSKWFELCENDKENITTEKTKALADEWGEKQSDLESRSSELFGLLCMLTEGEAKTIIRGQTNGIIAYQLIHRTYSRITLAKTIRTIREALVPKRAGHIG